ncbi:MAG: 3-deoxy-8-phosphooctulonate synthase [bacterium]|nr:3-deoxy-8-phosphooctulonate synthase [bacterium]
MKLMNKKSFFLAAGPCVIENEKMLYQTARTLIRITSKLNIPFIFKSSYDKANRTSVSSFRGPGLRKGLNILKGLKEKLKIPLLIDVHCTEEVEPVAEIADMIQIPAFLCRQTDLLQAAARTGKWVNVKKGQFLSPESVKYIIEKLETAGCREISITERGTSFGYGRLVVDFPGIPVMKKFGYPVLFDATHSVQLPSTGQGKTGGTREVIPLLLYSAVVSGADGIFMEVHPNPDKALSDRESQFSLSRVEKVLTKAKELYRVMEG